MGNHQNENEDFDFFCNQCYSHYLFEILTRKNINIRKYCFCGESTFLIDNKIKFLISNINECGPAYKMSSLSNYAYGYDGISNTLQKSTKYCPICEVFLYDELAIKHEHKNLINLKEYNRNCFFHRDSILIGFCKTCVKPICKKCVNSSVHKAHNFKYTKDLINNVGGYIENYESELGTAFFELDNLIKLKYGKQEKIKITNLQKSNIKNNCFYHKKDQQIILTLELLKTFLDIYYYHKKEDSIIYQTISNLLKHSNIKIFRNEKEELNTTYNPNNRFISISSDNQNNNSKLNETNSRNINIDLKIQLNDPEIRENRINIEFDKVLNNNIIKMIKLKNGNFALCEINKILFMKNFRIEERYIKGKNNIIDFIQLDNNKLVLLLDDLIDIYDINKESFILEKTINLEKGNYLLKNVNMNNFAVLGENPLAQESNLLYFKYPLYNEEKIMSIKVINKGDFILIDNSIIVCFGLLTSYKIFFYDLAKRKGDYIYIVTKTNSAMNKVNCFKIKNKKILISGKYYGFIFNVKTKQVETYINKFNNINFFGKIGNYLIVVKNRKIWEISFKNGIIYNEFILSENKSSSAFSDCLMSAFEVGNNQFCLLYGYDCILFNYY